MLLRALQLINQTKSQLQGRLKFFRLISGKNGFWCVCLAQFICCESSSLGHSPKCLSRCYLIIRVWQTRKRFQSQGNALFYILDQVYVLELCKFLFSTMK